MQTFFLLIGFLIGGAIAYWVAQSLEQTKQASRIRELESKIRLTLGEASDLKEKFSNLRGEADALRKTLGEERLEKVNTIQQLSQSFKRGILTLGAACLALGLSLGGGAAWWTVSTQADARSRLQHVELELNARLAELKVDVLQKQTAQLEKDLNQMNVALTDERVEKSVALTKLKILLESLSLQRGMEGFTIDYDKLRKNLNQNLEPQTTPQDLGLLKSSSARP